MNLNNRLIVFIIAVFLVQIFFPIEQYFYFVPAFALSRPWTFITSIFLHADFSHLFFNMFALWIFGMHLERQLSRTQYLAIFFLAGIVGNLGYMVTAPNATTPGLGASGAIYGVMGTLALLMPSMIVFVGGIPMPMFVAAFVWALTEYLGLFAPGNIAHGSHLAGLFIGIGYGLYLRRKINI